MNEKPYHNEPGFERVSLFIQSPYELVINSSYHNEPGFERVSSFIHSPYELNSSLINPVSYE